MTQPVNDKYLCLASYLYMYFIGDHFKSVLPYVRHNDEQ